MRSLNKAGNALLTTVFQTCKQAPKIIKHVMDMPLKVDDDDDFGQATVGAPGVMAGCQCWCQIMSTIQSETLLKFYCCFS